MKNLRYLIICLMATVIVKAQKPLYFEKTLSLGYVTEGWQVLPINDSTYFISGGLLYKNNLELHQPWTIQMNSYGDTSQSKLLNNVGLGRWLLDIIPTTSGFAYIGNQDSITHANACFGFLDKEGNVIKHTTVVRPNWSRSWAMTPTTDGGYLCVGTYAYNDAVGAPYIIKYNALGDLLWDSVYVQYAAKNMHSRLYDIEPTKDGTGYYIAGLTNEGFYEFPGGKYGDIDQADPWFFKIDEKGNILKEVIFVNEGWDLFFSFSYSNDDNFLFTGREDFENHLTKVNEDFTINWQTKISKEGTTPLILELPDKGYLAVGSGYDNKKTSIDNLITRLSSDGSILWQREYGVPTMHDYIFEAIRTDRGDIIGVGRQDSINTALLYILKTNCMGLLTEPKAEFVHVLASGYTYTFTNKSQYVYPDSIDGGHFIWDFGDGTPAQVVNSNAWQSHTFPAASNNIYTVTLTAVVCQDTSVYQETINTWPNGIENSPSSRALGVVSTNPAHQTATLTLNPNYTHLIHQGEALEIFNTQGQLVKTVPLSSEGETTTFSTANFTSGIYYCRLQNHPEIEGVKLLLY
ncbi:MAG: T9SS type A sorting domain-containing protein [Sphingobacteriales bacterium]|nr:T9SS type A sorting domain-containing protein [Sphingobacteriales bacterium]MBK7526834.1 T9SS type A sorting domain-containing protein [Sphingobacteriales bacterium]MBK8677328.1 T9SS type A sorting domain-containing protein [Sphingobacteriales bacterium]